MEKNRGLHLLYKNLGETPNEAVLRFKADNAEYTNTPMTYAGRLDPMAEGLLVILSGEALKEKEKYLGLTKTYVFEILWGFSTDTLDLLGLVSDSNPDTHLAVKPPSGERLKDVLGKSVGKFEQSYPAYSSKPVLGKPLFQWAREGRLSEVEIPNHGIEIFDAKFISRKFLSGKDLLEDIENKISLVSGDFRQNHISDKWNDLLSKAAFDIFTIDTIEATVSSGFYVRQFVSDMAKSLETKATTFHIKRTKIGDLQFSDDND